MTAINRSGQVLFAGCKVYVIDDEKLVKAHCELALGWTNAMLEFLGKEGMATKIDDNVVLVEVGDDRGWWFPCAMLDSPREAVPTDLIVFQWV